MEQYEIDSYNRRLVELFNRMSDLASSGEIGEWLTLTPEVAKICVLLYDETDDEKYRELLMTVVTQLDKFLVPTIERCSIEKKEPYNRLRLKLKNKMKNI